MSHRAAIDLDHDTPKDPLSRPLHVHLPSFHPRGRIRHYQTNLVNTFFINRTSATESTLYRPTTSERQANSPHLASSQISRKTARTRSGPPLSGLAVNLHQQTHFMFSLYPCLSIFQSKNDTETAY